MVLALFILIFGTSAAGAFLLPRQYDSNMKVLVKKERADVMVTPERTIGLSERGDVEEAAIYSEVELLSSADILWPVAKLSLDARRRAQAENGVESTPSGTTYPAAPDHTEVEEEYRALRNNLEIIPVRKSNVIQVSYRDDNPQLANFVLRLIAGRYLDAHVKLHGAAGTYEVFKSETERYHRELLEAERQLRDFLDSRNITDLTEEKNLQLQKMLGWQASARDLEASLEEFINRVAELQHQLDLVPSRLLTESRNKPNLYLVDGLHPTTASSRP
jgi:uncharacterized protein involved in exopolysaccharide biosynthesis